METYCLNFCMQIPKGLKSTKDISLERQLRGEGNINQYAINSENNVTFLDKFKKEERSDSVRKLKHGQNNHCEHEPIMEIYRENQGCQGASCILLIVCLYLQ